MISQRIFFLWTVFFLAVFGLGFLLPAYWLYLATTVAITALIARSVGILTDQLGIVSLAHMSFASIGGWIVSWAILNLPSVPFVLVLIFASVLVSAVGWLIGFLTLRVRGAELAVVTLGFAAALDVILRRGSFPGASTGTSVTPQGILSNPIVFYFFVLLILVVLNVSLSVLKSQRVGLQWHAVRVSEKFAASLGVRIWAVKTSGFLLSAFFAGIAGGLLAVTYGILTANVFSPFQSLTLLAAAVLTGAGIFGGALLAGALTVLMPEVLRRLNLPLDISSALLAVGAFDILRRGNGGIANIIKTRIENRTFQNTPKVFDFQNTDLQQTSSEALSEKLAQPSLATVLELRDVTVSVGKVKLLDSVSVTLKAGEIHALVGANGAGKTTFIDAVTGFHRLAGGEIFLDGNEISNLDVRSRVALGIRRTFQESAAISTLRVGEYLRLASGSVRDSRELQNLKEAFGAPDDELPIRLMDIGSRRILELMGAVSSRPRVLLLDEPAAGLSVLERSSLAKIILDLAKQNNIAILVIEHDADFVAEIADTVTTLEAGSVAQLNGNKNV